MRVLRIALVLVFWAAIAALPSRPESQVTLRGVFEGRLLKFTGTAPLPDGTILRLRLSRLQERHRLGALEPAWIDAGGAVVEVRDGRFSCDEPPGQPGVYRAVLEDRAVDVFAWDDDFMRRILRDRQTLEFCIREVRTIDDRMWLAAGSQGEWLRWGPEILSDALRVQKRTRWLAGPGALYPAAEPDLLAAIRTMTSVPPHFFWTPEGFGGSYDPTTASWVPGPDGAPFGFARTMDHLDGVLDVLKRECSLWVVKDTRRVHQDVARRHPTFREPVEEMEQTLDRIEAGIRGHARVARDVPLPPVPPRFVEVVTHNTKVQEARKILQQADRLWEQLGDQKSPSLYRKLQNDYRDVLDELQARVRVGNRARAESE